MPHIIEAAKSARAACRKCREKIAKGELRLGVEIDGDFGSSHQWYHLKCGAQARAAELEEALGGFTEEVPDRAEIDAEIAKNKGKKGKADRDYPFAETAASGRSTCIACSEKIAKGEYRVAVEMEIDTGAFATTGARYLHARCAAGHLGEDAKSLLPTLVENGGLDEAQAGALAQAMV